MLGENNATCHPSTAVNAARPKIHTLGDTQYRPAQAPLPCHPRRSQGGACHNINTTVFQTTTVEPTKLETTTVETKCKGLHPGGLTCVVSTMGVTTFETTGAENAQVNTMVVCWSPSW